MNPFSEKITRRSFLTVPALLPIAPLGSMPGSISVWDGLGDEGKPVPAGSYNVVVETNPEHGGYGRQTGAILCGGADPADLMLSTTPDADAISAHYGPKSPQA